jgi:hypothetical protein
LPLPQFFNELLRLVYRLIFLLAAEDRGLLHPPDAPEQARKIYAEGYSLGALRDRAIRRSGWDQFHDRWEGLLIVFRALANGQPRLALPALGGLFEEHGTSSLDSARLSNRALMEAVFRLAWIRDDSVIVPVNWRDMETEELGSVYEGLLELTTRLTQDGRSFAFTEGLEAKGNERKKTGSYYTPDSLVQALLDSALDPVLDRIESDAEDPSAALLSVTVIDPACGSGHFLLAAARRIATRIARTRTGGLPSTTDYRHALRDTVRCCVHGVDRNPMAVELTRVALWIETVEPGKPLGFLDANIRVGDSLLGIFSLDALRKGIPDAAYKPLSGDHKPTAKDFEKRNKRDKGEAAGILDFSGKRAQPVELPPLAASLRAVRGLPEDTVQEIESKRDSFHSVHSDPRLVNLAQAADLYIAAFLTPMTEAQSLDLHTSLVPTTFDVWTSMRGGTVYGPRLGVARQLATDAHAFHWPLEFPDIMANGGFDVVLGNPPWERIKTQEQEFFASREAAIAEAPNAAARRRMIEQIKSAPEGSRERALYDDFELAKRIAEASSEFARLTAQEGGRFPLTGRGDVNTYALFAELFASIHSDFGYAGIIAPTGLATDLNTSLFFRQLTKTGSLVRLAGFENEEFIFPSVHNWTKFGIFTFGPVRQSNSKSSFIFLLRGVDGLTDPRRIIDLSYDDLSLLNPNTGTVPIFRTKTDAELTQRIYRNCPILLLDSNVAGSNPWGIHFLRMFDMATDSGCFVEKDFLASDMPAKGIEREANNGEAFIPLYEGKMLHLYNYRHGDYSEHKFKMGKKVKELLPPSQESLDNPNFEVQPRYWVPLSEVRKRLVSTGWDHNWLMGWRNVSSSVNERTWIGSFLPITGAGNSILLFFTNRDPRLSVSLLSNLSSLFLDFVARQKVAGLNFTYNYFSQLPVLPPDFYSTIDLDFIVSRVVELTYCSFSMTSFAQDLGYSGKPFAWDEARRAVLRAELDAWYARAYGLTRDELRYVLDPNEVMGPNYPSESFRVLKNTEINTYGEFRTRRLILDAWDRMERGELPTPEPYDQRHSASAPSTKQAVPVDSGNSGQGKLQFTPERTR